MMILFVSALFILSGCSKGDNKGHDSHGSHGGGQSVQTGDVKTVVADDIQAAFELYSRAKHEEMAKDMKVSSMTYDKKSDRFIIVSLLKKEAKTIIKDASVEVEIVTPDKKNVKKKAHTMEGGGMFHYAADFQMTAKGIYKVNAIITMGAKKVTASTELEVK